MIKKILLPVLGALALALPLHASALCALCSCSVNTTPVAFGTYDPQSASPRDSDGSVLFTCGGVVGGVVTYDVALGMGLNSTAFSPRKMSSGVNLLNYDIYTSSTRSSIWGDGTAGSQKVSGSITVLLVGGSMQELVVYGRIPGSQTAVRTGIYNDSVLVTVTYN